MQNFSKVACIVGLASTESRIISMAVLLLNRLGPGYAWPMLSSDVRPSGILKNLVARGGVLMKSFDHFG